MSNPNDYTKPSRVKRRLKRRWKKQQLGNLTYCAYLNRLIKLTAARLAATMPVLFPSLEAVGRGNPKVLAKIAAAFSGFFMRVILRGVMPCPFCYGGLFWAAFGAGRLQYPVFHPISVRRPIPWKVSAAVYSSVLELPQ